jgi:hypothetical protein
MVVVVRHSVMYSLTTCVLLLSDVSLLRTGKLKLTGSSTCRWYVNPDIPEAEALRDRFNHFDTTRIYIPSNLLGCSKICKCRSLMPAPVWQDGHSVGSNARPISITQLKNYEDPHEILVST